MGGRGGWAAVAGWRGVLVACGARACLVAFVSGLVSTVHSICAAQLHGQHCIVGRGRGRAHWPWSCAAWWRGRWWRGVGWLPWGRGGRWRHCLPSLLGTRMHNVRRGQVWPTSACALHTAGAPARRLFSTLGPLYSAWHVAWKKLWGGWRRRARGRFMVPRCWLSLCFFRLTRRLHPRVLVPSLSPPHAATVAVVGPA